MASLDQHKISIDNYIALVEVGIISTLFLWNYYSRVYYVCDYYVYVLEKLKSCFFLWCQICVIIIVCGKKIDYWLGWRGSWLVKKKWRTIWLIAFCGVSNNLQILHINCKNKLLNNFYCKLFLFFVDIFNEDSADTEYFFSRSLRKFKLYNSVN